LRCSNNIANGDLKQHLYTNHEESIESYIELLQRKIEELESNMLKEKRNSKLNVIHDERIIKQPGSKLIDMDGEQMEG
jgi:hemerythrin superfamily protein